METSAVIGIGNSDNKLTQKQWAEFIFDVNRMIDKCHLKKHFVGYSAPTSPWQNACWVVGIEEDSAWIDWLSQDLCALAQKYGQESIALTVGLTSFIKPKDD